MSDLTIDERIETKIRTILFKNGEMKRRDLQGRCSNRDWSGTEFNAVLDRLIVRDVVSLESTTVALIDRTPVLSVTEQRRQRRVEARKVQSPRFITPEIARKSAAWNRTKGRCWFCGVQTNPFDDFVAERDIPLLNGGTDEPANMLPACRTCADLRDGRTVEQFRALLPTGHRFWFEIDERANGVGR